jgi:hypothetical protein
MTRRQHPRFHGCPVSLPAVRVYLAQENYCIFGIPGRELRIISAYTRVRTLIMVLWRASAMISRRVSSRRVASGREDRDGHRVTRIASLLPLAVTQTNSIATLFLSVGAQTKFLDSWFFSQTAPSPALPNL